jgi:hypothetical protein
MSPREGNSTEEEGAWKGKQLKSKKKKKKDLKFGIKVTSRTIVAADMHCFRAGTFSARVW